MVLVDRLVPPQATGYGVVEFAKCVLEDKGDTIKGKRCLISGSGKVSSVASLKCMGYFMKPV